MCWPGRHSLNVPIPIDVGLVGLRLGIGSHLDVADDHQMITTNCGNGGGLFPTGRRPATPTRSAARGGPGRPGASAERRLWGVCPVGGRLPLGSRMLLTAAGVVCLVAVASDLSADEAPLHVLTLGAVIAMVVVARLRLAPSSDLLRILKACVLIQPALHAAAKLVPHGQVEHGVGQQIGQADIAVTLNQVVVATAIVGVASLVEQVVAAVVGVIRVTWNGLRPARITEPVPAVRPAPSPELLTNRYRPGVIARRGPPASRTSVA